MIPGFDRMQAATKKAFDRVGKATNVETDPDLALYGTLKPEHFTELMKTYGEEPIVNYIKDMEAKRIMGGKRA
jgi:hypothetical protein